MKSDLTTLELQRKLNSLGYGPLKEDGQYGKNTAEAYKRYLDEIDPSVPTVIPQPEIKWWMSKPLITAVSTILVSIIGMFGYQIESEYMSEMLLASVTLITGVLGVVGAVKNKANIDTTHINPIRRMQMPSNDPRGFFADPQ